MRKQDSKLLLIGLLLLLGGGLVAVYLTGGNEAPETTSIESAARPQAPSALETRVGDVKIIERDTGGVELARGVEVDAESNVLWPLEVGLTLRRSSELPEVPGRTQLGSGRTARIKGRIADPSGDPPSNTSIHFSAGPNAGRVLVTDSEGRFGANDLYPGISVVEIRGEGLIGARREVRLRQGKEELFNMGFGRPGSVAGRVVDDKGEPIVGGAISFDGQATTSDDEGYFFLPRVASGRVLAEVSHPGFATWRSTVGVTAAHAITVDRMTIKLKRAAALTIRLKDDVGGPAPVHVFVTPVGVVADRDFAWSRINPIKITQRETTIEGLPEQAVRVHAFRTGVMAEPRMRQVRLSAGAKQVVDLTFQPAPAISGTVIRDGKIVSGATVRLVAADPVQATLEHLREPASYLESEVLPLLPPARQEVTTDASGRFRMTRWDQTSRYRLLEAISPDGQARALRAVGPDDEDVELVLEDPDVAGRASLTLQIPKRFQDLPVEVVVDGRPRDPFALEADEDLAIDGLTPGTWDLSVRWYTELILDESGIEIVGTVEREIELPEDAIIGQDRETWERAGQNYPG